MWIDLNVPYYGTADTAHPDLPGCRQMYPAELPDVMNDVFARRCADCHQDQQPTMVKDWTPRTSRWRGDALGLRIERPELNAFLLAPLPASAGGTGKCGTPVFDSTADADYQALLRTFEPVQELARKTPRMDMPGAVPAAVCFEVRSAARDRTFRAPRLRLHGFAADSRFQIRLTKTQDVVPEPERPGRLTSRPLRSGGA
jgi:hypothetical protein